MFSSFACGTLFLLTFGSTGRVLYDVAALVRLKERKMNKKDSYGEISIVYTIYARSGYYLEWRRRMGVRRDTVESKLGLGKAKHDETLLRVR
jgi:hypothetical protein